MLKSQQIILGLSIFSILSPQLTSPGLAQETILAVIQSSDNSAQWTQITNRLEQLGVRYCVIPWSKVSTPKDLAVAPVILLPNIELFNASQVQALKGAIDQGSKLIVTGAVGTNSTMEIKHRLRNLLGVYWSYPFSLPSTIEPAPASLTTDEQSKQLLTGSIRGGMVLPKPSQPNQIAAFWDGSNKLPAVINTNQVIYLGWRWGTNAVSSLQLDQAWLHTSLRLHQQIVIPGATIAKPAPMCHGTYPTQITKKPVTPLKAQMYQVSNNFVFPTFSKKTNPSTTPKPTTPPPPPPNQILLGWTEQYTLIPDDQSLPQNPVVQPPTIAINSTNTTSIPNPPPAAPASTPSPEFERLALSRQFERLVEENLPSTSTSTSTNPANLRTPQLYSMGQELEKLLGRFESAARITQTTAQKSSATNINQTISTARQGLQNFHSLADQNPEAAKTQWIQTRRMIWDNYHNQKLPDFPEVRAIWLDRKTIVQAGSEAELAKIFDRLSAAGFNTVFFETVNAGFALYSSEVIPEKNPSINKDWDPLASAIKLAHARNMELHAWVWVFAAGNQLHNGLINKPKSYPGPVVERHPDWVDKDRHGGIFSSASGKVFLDSANPEVRQYLIKVLAEIATKYKVDGIQLDYIRGSFPSLNKNTPFGYGDYSRKLFQQTHGIDPVTIPSSDPHWWPKWRDFRKNQVTTFVKEAAQKIRNIRSNIIISAAVFPFPRIQRLNVIHQDWETWAKDGDVDLIFPMTYALNTPEFQLLAEPLLPQQRLWWEQPTSGSALILPGIQLRQVPSAIALDQIQAVRDLPTVGYALFANEHLDSTLHQVFRQVQGDSSKNPLPHRYPFKAAMGRFLILEREWNTLIKNKQINVSSQQNQTWKTQTESINHALNQLAKKPSSTNLNIALNELKAFRNTIKAILSSNQSYQAQVIQNRLLTIDRLLQYGSRKIVN